MSFYKDYKNKDWDSITIRRKKNRIPADSKKNPKNWLFNPLGILKKPVEDSVFFVYRIPWDSMGFYEKKTDFGHICSPGLRLVCKA